MLDEEAGRLEHIVVRTLLFLRFPAGKQLAMSNLSGCQQRRSENGESESGLVEPGHLAGFLSSQVGGGSAAISTAVWQTSLVKEDHLLDLLLPLLWQAPHCRVCFVEKINQFLSLSKTCVV